MNLLHLIRLVGLACVLAAAANAGAPPDRSREPSSADRERWKARGEEFLDRFIRHLADGDEAEYQRLQTLHREDPDQFRKELEERRDQARCDQLRGGLHDFPTVLQAIEALPENEQSAFTKRVGELLAGPRRTGPEGANRGGWPPRKDGSNRQDDRELQDLVTRFRQASDADKVLVLKDLRAQLETQFERGEEDRRRMIESVEKRLEELRRMMAERSENRSDIIEDRLREVLADPAPPRGP